MARRRRIEEDLAYREALLLKMEKFVFESFDNSKAYFTVTVLVMGSFLHSEQLYLSGNISHPQSPSFLEETISPTTIVFNIMVLICATIGIFTSFLLVYGLYSDNKFLLVPWILTVMTTSLVDLAHSLYLFYVQTMTFDPPTAILFTVDFFLLTLNVYSLLCVVSQYQEYKAGRGTADFDYLNRRVPGVKYTPQPTGTSFLSTRRAVTYHETKASPTDSPSSRTGGGGAAGGGGGAHGPQSRKHVQWGGGGEGALLGGTISPPAVIHLESPKDSVSSDLNGKSGGSPSEEGGSSVEWTGGAAGVGCCRPGGVVDTLPLLNPPSYEEVVSMPII